MNEKTNNSQNSTPGPGGGARRNNNRRRHHNPNRNAQGAQNSPNAEKPAQNAGAPGHNPNQKRRHNNNNNRPKGPAQNHDHGPQMHMEKLYEKYLNLLDQHLIARRKYHDLFFRADPNQKAKLERNFYNTINDVREFENKMTPEVRASFEKRNNGLAPDRIYTTNHELPIEGDKVSEDMEIIDPHLLQTQINSDYKNDSEESMGSIEDYLKYKGL